MLRTARLQTVLVLAAGALLGYLAASDKLNPFSNAQASPGAGAGAGDAAQCAEPAQCGGDTGAVSCSDGVGKGALLALATPAAAEPGGNAQASGKKPNIVFIMGDDIGWFNVGAYHQGIMAGRTPEPRPPRRSGDAVHRLLCRGELHCRSRQFHHRRTADPHGG